MSNERGVCYVAFGKNYAWQCLHSARSVRAVCGLPIHVFTNIELGPKWEALGGVTISRVEGDDKFNRAIKTDLINHSPFAHTLYLDTDTAVRSAKFIDGFANLASADIAGVSANESMRSVAELGPRVYRDAHALLGYRFPATLMNGGVMFFRKSAAAYEFFARWLYAWTLLGCGRDMPALAWALQNVPYLAVNFLSVAWNCPRNVPAAIISHAWGKSVLPGIPPIEKYKPSVHDNHTWIHTGARH